jgi:P pilus assembly chaperone PapD
MRAAALCAALLCALMPMTSAAQSAGVQVTPIVIQASPRTGLASFRVHNGHARETAYQLEAFEWTQANGESVLTPAEDVVLAPSVFLMPANGDQIVRLAVPRGVLGGARERSYRVLLRELPNQEAPQSGSRLVIEMSMPVFVTPAGARGALAVQRMRDADGAPVLRIENTGAARLNLADAPSAPDIENLPRYLLAGQHLIRPAPRDIDTLQLVTINIGDTAPQTQNFELADGPVLADLH